MKTSKIEAKNKIAIKGDRNEPIIAAIQDIYINRPELYKELAKVIDYELWDGYILTIQEEKDQILDTDREGEITVEKERRIWKMFYLNFNDDNLNHMEQAFQSLGGNEMTADQLHKKNLDWVKEIGVLTVLQNGNYQPFVELAEEYARELLTWRWNEKQDTGIQLFLDSLSDRENNYYPDDLICNVRCGELCFDLIYKETDPVVMKVFADLYVGGIDTGYGYSSSGYPYDFLDDVACSWNISEFEGKTLEEFKEMVGQDLTKCVIEAKEGHGSYKAGIDLFRKAEMPLHEW